jgi:hypothetical protein
MPMAAEEVAMKTVASIPGSGGRFFRAVGVLAACFALAGCNDDGPTAPIGNSAPTPLPVPSVAGTWNGTYRSCSAPVIGCGPTVSATATLAQDGSRVTGTVMAGGGGFGLGALEATLHEDQLRGTLTVGRGERKSLNGEASENHLILRFATSAISQGTIDLRR